MSEYGIKLIWGGGKDDDVIGFSPSAYKRWHNQIQPGTRMLLYETAKNKGVQGIVSEVEVIAGFAASAGLATPTQEHNHPVRVKVIRGKRSIMAIPKQRVQEVLGRPSFPQQNDSWTPISETTYRHLLSSWGKR